MLSFNRFTLRLTALGILLLSIVSAPALAEEGTYVVTFKEINENGAFKGVSTFLYNPVTKTPASVSININWANTINPAYPNNFAVNAAVSSISTHGDDEGANSGSSRVKGIDGTYSDGPAQFSFKLAPTGNDDSRGTWTIEDDSVTPTLVTQGFYILRNAETVTNINVPEPSLGLILLTGLIPLGLLIRRRRNGR